MAAVTVPNGGTYDIEVDVGYPVDGFRLDDSTAGVLNGTTYVLDGTTSYASVASGTTRASVRRGRRDERDQFPAGTMTFVLNDTAASGVFGPFDDAPTNPNWDQTGDVPGLAPGRAVRFTRYDSTNAPELLFAGYIVNYDYTFTLGGLDTVTVYCTDALYRLAQTFLTAHNPTKELTGARVNAILNRAEVNYPTGAARNIAAGTVELGGGGSYAIREGTNVRAYFEQITATAERGRIFVDREGTLVSQDRIGTTLSGPVVVFSDQGTDVPYRAVGIAFQAEDIVNRAAVTPAGGTQQVAEDLASQALYFVKSTYIDGSLLHDNAAALALANYLLAPEPDPRFTDVETWFARLTTAQRDAVAIVEIGDTVQITKDVLIGGVPTPRTQELSVEGVEHVVDFAAGQTSRFYTAPTALVYGLVLDDATYGTLDGANAVI